MQLKDIDAGHVIELAQRWREDSSSPGVVRALMDEGVPEKLAVSKVMQLAREGRLEYGTSPYYAWPPWGERG